MKAVDISFIVPNRNSSATIKESIASIFQQKYLGKIEVIIVDNLSKDGCLELVKDFPLKVVTNPKTSLARSMNMGIKESKHDWVCIWFPDYTFPSTTALAEYIEKITDGLQAIAVDPVDTFEPQDNFAYYLQVRNTKPWNGIKHFLFKKSLLEQLGYYDEVFGIGGEDTDIVLRLAKNGTPLTPCGLWVNHTHKYYNLTRTMETYYLIAKCNGLLFRKHRWVESFFKNGITRTILYLGLALPTSTVLCLFVIFFESILYTMKMVSINGWSRYTPLLPFYKIWTGIVYTFAFWDGMISYDKEKNTVGN